MSFYKYRAPANWNGYIDIDEPIDLDKINMEQNFEVEEEEEDPKILPRGNVKSIGQAVDAKSKQRDDLKKKLK